jgi:hypothetical protein
VRWKKDGDKAFTGLPVAVGAITADESFMRALQRGYEDKMCGFWRRVFSLKSLRFRAPARGTQCPAKNEKWRH